MVTSRICSGDGLIDFCKVKRFRWNEESYSVEVCRLYVISILSRPSAFIHSMITPILVELSSYLPYHIASNCFASSRIMPLSFSGAANCGLCPVSMSLVIHSCPVASSIMFCASKGRARSWRVRM